MKPKKEQTSNDQPEDLFPRILASYKRRCQTYAVIPNPTIKQHLEKSVQTLKLEQIKLSEQIGPIQIRSLMQSLLDCKYAKIKGIEIWKGKIGDEGVRHICRYLEGRDGNAVEVLDLLENQVGELGCQFLGKVFLLPYTRIKYLKLDDNLIGNKGLEALSRGLRTNSHLTKLSLKYCGIDQKGMHFIQDILANIHSKIRSIKLQGNPLRNEGIYQFLRVVQLNEMLEKINIADTGLNLLDFVAKNLYVVDENYVEEEVQEGEEGEEDNPEKRESTPGSNINNVKEVVLPDSKKSGGQAQKQKVLVLKQVKPKSPQKKQHLKISKSISQTDKSPSANLLRLLSSIMRQNLLIRKYDLRFNPISNDAAIILFEIIEQNSQIKDVEFNGNVDAGLRENLDTLMRKRTGRMPKGGRAKGGKGKKKKK